METADTTILIIEDEQYIGQIFSDFLEDSGYQTAVASNGREGLEKFKEVNPDVVLSDINMPELDGFGVVEGIRNAGSDIPIIIVSGINSIKDAMRALKMGAWDFLTKPIEDMEILLHTIQRALERYELIEIKKRYEKHLEEEVKSKTARLKTEITERTKSEERYLLLFESARDAIILLENEKILDCNSMAATQFGMSKDELAGKNFSDFIIEDEDGIIQKGDGVFPIGELLASPHPVDCTFRRGSDSFAGEVSFSSLEQQGETFIMGIIRDITERKKTEDELKKLSSSIEQSPAMVMITDPDASIVYVNKKFTEVTGYSSHEALGKNPSILNSGVMPDSVYTDLWKTISGGEEWRGEFHNRKKNGELYWESAIISSIKDDKDRIKYYVATKEDITIRKEYEDRLMYQANYDALTGLPNQALLMDRLSEAIGRSKKLSQPLVLMMLDLDQFKLINETLGHDRGDILLTETAERLKESIDSADTVARFSGDKFLILLQGLKDPIEAETVAERVLHNLAVPYILDNQEIRISASIGISIFPGDADTAQIMLQNADAAMYQSKRDGRNRFNYYGGDINEKAKRRFTLEGHLRHALEKNELFPVFQPKVLTVNEVVCGAESLIRWQSPELGFVRPDEFISVAEDSGLIVDIGEFMLRRACEAAVKWSPLSEHPVSVAVNVSSQQFKDEHFIKKVESALSDTGLKPELLELEITESIMVTDVEETIRILHEFVDMGIQISVDDFGTGYSSLSYLRRFPVHTLKIDKAFVDRITERKEDDDLVRAIIAMGHSLGMKVIAEGVETDTQLLFLKSFQCNIIQGYYYSKPLPLDEFMNFIKNWKQ
jgi:diguanylate cyclase (GGDEF)-like protein/PAS domain S-box-containing protein